MLAQQRHLMCATFLAGLMALLLTACSDDSDVEPMSSSSAELAAPGPSSHTAATPGSVSSIPAVPEAATDVEGNVVKELTVPAELLDAATGEVVARVTVQAIEVREDCPGEFAVSPENGAYVVLDLEAWMAEGRDADDLLLLGPAMWHVLDENGNRVDGLETDAAWSCFDTAERLPYTLASGEQVSGLVVLDSPVAAGTVVFSPTGGQGWSWPIAIDG